MTRREKVEWLSRYRDAVRMQQQLCDELEEAQTNATRITPLLSGMPGGGADGDKLAKAVERVVECRQRLIARVGDAQAVRNEVEAAIDTVPNETGRVILRARFVTGKRVEHIAPMIGYSVPQTFRLYRLALTAVVINDSER